MMRKVQIEGIGRYFLHEQVFGKRLKRGVFFRVALRPERRPAGFRFVCVNGRRLNRISAPDHRGAHRAAKHKCNHTFLFHMYSPFF